MLGKVRLYCVLGSPVGLGSQGKLPPSLFRGSVLDRHFKGKHKVYFKADIISIKVILYFDYM